jgi:hypothetical protein
MSSQGMDVSQYGGEPSGFRSFYGTAVAFSGIWDR